jgi:hypothetical protein
MNWPLIRKFFLKSQVLLVVYSILAIIASIQFISLGTHKYLNAVTDTTKHDIVDNAITSKLFVGKSYYDYNNYVIFRQSYPHLRHGQNLYALYPDEQYDLYKYSPTFALWMAPFSKLPDYLGLTLWSLINALALLFAIRMLPFTQNVRGLLCWFVAVEMLTALQNAQSNALMAGIMIAAFCCLHNGKVQWATLWLVLATFIKVYGAIGFCLFLFYPGKLRFVLFAALWTVLFFAMPLVATPLHTLLWQYNNWLVMLAADQAGSYGLSVWGWLHAWFGIQHGKSIVTIIGIVLFLLPLTRIKMYSNIAFRLLMLASMLIWVIIFNHKAESPTFVIAVAGVGIWYFTRPYALWRAILLWSVFLFTTLSVSDVFPPGIKNAFFLPYAIKVVPCILVWVVLVVQLFTLKKDAIATNEDTATV